MLLGRMLRQVEVDDRYKRRRKRTLVEKIADLMNEFQKEVKEANGHDAGEG
jgi:hypothetical protein